MEATHNLNRQITKIEETAHHAIKRKREAEEAEAESGHLMKVVEPRMLGLYGTEGAAWGILLIVIAAVYLVDALFFRPAIEYIVWRYFAVSHESWMMPFLQFAVPAIVMILELGIAVQIYLRSGTSKDSSYWLFLILGALMAISMPSVVIGVLLVDAPSKLPFHLIFFGCIVFSLVAHVSILFGGRPAQEAKEYFHLKRKYNRLQRKLRRANTSSAELAHRAFALFREYDTQRGTGPVGIFDKETAELVNQQAGKPIIE